MIKIANCFSFLEYWRQHCGIVTIRSNLTRKRRTRLRAIESGVEECHLILFLVSLSPPPFLRIFLCYSSNWTAPLLLTKVLFWPPTLRQKCWITYHYHCNIHSTEWSKICIKKCDLGNPKKVHKYIIVFPVGYLNFFRCFFPNCS